jgi:PAP2 superfamily
MRQGPSRHTAGFLPTMFAETLRRARADTTTYLCIALYAALGFLFLTLNGAGDRAAYFSYMGQAVLLALLLFPFSAVIADSVGIIHRFDKRRKLAFRRVFTPRRFGSLLTGAVLLTGILFFQGVFTSIKNGLVIWQGGFHYDVTLAAVDAKLSFGVDPWRWIAPLIEWAPMRSFAEYNYGKIWFLMAFGTVYFVASSPKADAVRSRYLVSYMLVWLLVGNVVAGIFMSAGPVYYGQVTGDTERFSDLLAFLASGNSAGDTTVQYQAYLWDLHESGQSGFASGISAFPSVHVGLVVMNALFAWDANRRLGSFMAVYALFVMASSVALGWHYAVDGYASAVIVVMIHAVLKWIYARRGNAAFESQMRPITAH